MDMARLFLLEKPLFNALNKHLNKDVKNTDITNNV